MHPIPPRRADRRWRTLLAAVAVFQAGALEAQPPRQPTPPDFSQPAITTTVEQLVAEWNRWNRETQGIEQRLFRLPMSEARDLLQHALGAYQEFLAKRHAYSEAVASYIERSRAEPRARQTPVALGTVYEDQILTLGLNLDAVQARLDSMREAPEWISIRRAVQPETTQAMKLQSARRSEMPLDLSLTAAQNASPMSALIYRDSERQLEEELLRLWTRYYQSLADAAEQKPNGSAPLVAARSGETAPAAPAPGPAAPAAAVSVPRPAAAAAAAPQNPLVGVWTYAEGSQQFNGAAEPREVMLELWIEGGQLNGRYRAQLPDFDGVKAVDVRLHGVIAAGGGEQALDFESKDPPASGRLILEGPAPNGLDLMVVRAPSSPGGLPRGRELLRRR